MIGDNALLVTLTAPSTNSSNAGLVISMVSEATSAFIVMVNVIEATPLHTHTHIYTVYIYILSTSSILISIIS
ncbi:hypothetical protein C2G38_2083659, partial [Gigaspora rosea]